MQDLHYQKALDSLEDRGLELLTEDRKILAAAPMAARAHLIALIERALITGTPATPNTVVRYRTCGERLTEDHAPAMGRHAKGGA